MVKMILLALVGVIIGVAGDELVRMFVLPKFFPELVSPQIQVGEEGEVKVVIPIQENVLAKLPYDMVIGETKFAERPLFCISNTTVNTETYQHCRVSPGFYATFTKNVLSHMVWSTDEQSRFHKEWRKAGLNTNQSGKEFLEVITKLGASNFRDEMEDKTRKVMTFDVGHFSYRLWLLPKTQGNADKPELYFHKLETILSF